MDNTERLWLYYRTSDGNIRSRLFKYENGEKVDIDDAATKTLAESIYKAWTDVHGWLGYPRLLILPKGVFLNDGSGCMMCVGGVRDVSYHRLDDEHAGRVLNYNGNSWKETAKQRFKYWWNYRKYVVSEFFRNLFSPKYGRDCNPLQDEPCDIEEKAENVQ